MMTSATLPEGYKLVPLEAPASAACWSLYLVAREAGEAGPADWVVLQNPPYCYAYLGCICDGEGRVREWVQLWVQNAEEASAPEAGEAEGPSNQQLDVRWERHWQATGQLSPGAVLFRSPLETLEPLYLDPLDWKITSPRPAAGGRWMLCRDDEVLTRASLAAYSNSRSRYLLAQGAADGEAHFVPALRPDLAGAAGEELGADPAWLALNPQAAPMAARTHALLDFEDYADLLGGATVAEIGARKRECEAQLLSALLAPEGRETRRHGLLLDWNNPAEVFYLKLRLLCQTGRALLTHLRETQAPLLNLDPASFGVFLAGPGELPWSWTTVCELVRPGRAVPLPIQGTGVERFIGSGNAGAPGYCPAGLESRDHNVTILLRDVKVERDRVSLEVTIKTKSPVHVSASDWVCFRLSSGRVTGDFYGTVSSAEEGRELRLWTLPRPMSPRESEELCGVKTNKYNRFERCWCQLIPALSSPYDLYSLAVLGGRALLCHHDGEAEGNSLGEVVDALESLGREVGEKLPAEADWRAIVTAVENRLRQEPKDPRLTQEHLLGWLPDRGAGANWLPASLWAETLAVLLRLMPGLPAISQCEDYGQAASGQLHVPLEQPLAELESLCARARSLVFSDWNANREMRSVLEGLRSLI